MPLLSTIGRLVSSLIGLAGAVPAWSMEVHGIDLHGFVSQGYLHSSGNDYLGDTRDGSFEFNEVGLNLSTELGDDLRVGVQIISYDIGDFGNNRPAIDWAHGDYHYDDRLGLRIGRFKLPLGFYNEIQDIDVARTQIFLPQSCYPAGYRDIMLDADGIQAYGNLPLGAGGDLDYQVYLGDMQIEADGSLAYIVQNLSRNDLVPTTFDIGLNAGATLSWNTPLTGLRLRSSYMLMHDMYSTGMQRSYALPYEQSFDDFHIVFAGFEYTWERCLFVSEYVRMRTDYTTMIEVPGHGVVHQEGAIDYEGWYVSMGYELTDWCNLALTYSETYDDADDRQGDGYAQNYYAWQRDGYLSARFDLDTNWFLKAEGHYVDGVSGLFGGTGAAREEEWVYGALKATFVF